MLCSYFLPRKYTEIAANARLIAAAPDLLEAAKLLNVVLCANELTGSQVDCLFALRNAIAKTEGSK